MCLCNPSLKSPFCGKVGCTPTDVKRLGSEGNNDWLKPAAFLEIEKREEAELKHIQGMWETYCMAMSFLIFLLVLILVIGSLAV